MQAAKRITALAMFIFSLWLFSVSGAYSALEERLISGIDGRRMKNVVITHMTAPEPESEPAIAREPEVDVGGGTPLPTAVPAMSTVPEYEELTLPGTEGLLIPEDAEPYYGDAPDLENIKETTIRGGLSIKNETGYWVDAPQIISDGPALTLPAGEVQILIIHTHSSEAYTQAGLDRYESSDNNRTEDTEFNIVRIGDELTRIFQEHGLGVIHDRGIYDYPSYTGSYTRSGDAITQYLADYPGIGVVIDMHRDALGSDGVVYKTMAEEEGVCASQVMLLVGTDESGLEHPLWRDNLSLALYLQNAVNSTNPTLMRPVDLVPQRYNQHLSPGSLIMEVGSSGNTLQEALAGIRLFGNAAAPALLELVQGQTSDDADSSPE